MCMWSDLLPKPASWIGGCFVANACLFSTFINVVKKVAENAKLQNVPKSLKWTNLSGDFSSGSNDSSFSSSFGPIDLSSTHDAHHKVNIPEPAQTNMHKQLCMPHRQTQNNNLVLLIGQGGNFQSPPLP